MGRLGDKVWLELGRREMHGRLEQLDRCLVGRWENVSTSFPKLDFLKNWVYHTWLLKERLNIVVLGEDSYFFEFKVLSEAERVLAKGKRRGTYLPLFRLWLGRGISQSICGGKPHLGILRWCRREVFSGKGVTTDEDEVGGRPRAACSGSVLEKEFQSKEQTRVKNVSPFGSSSKSSSSDSCTGGIGPEAIVGEENLRNKDQGAHNRSGPRKNSHEIALAETQLQGVEMGLKGEKTLYHSTVAETEARASEEALQAQDREDKGLVCFLGWATRDSKSFTANVRAEITNKALAAEASKYNFFPFVFGGIEISSLLLLLMVREEVDKPEFDETLQERECILPRPVSTHFPILLDGDEEMVEVNKRLALEKVAFWDSQEKLRSLSMEELEARKETKGDYKKWTLMEEISWRQKSREIGRGFFRSLRLNDDKASSPDGFSLSFWHFCWDFVKDEVMGFMKSSMSREDLLKKVVGNVVSSTQNAFVEGRQILDAALITNENGFWGEVDWLDFLVHFHLVGSSLEHHLSLRINLDKSEILLIGKVENLEDLTLEFGCKVGRLPISYLGLPLGVHHKSMAV
ncbi:hypothetical protein CK203_051802 [Vitis vinifera]|uniref:DUF4283 domain-containing protein n=1 Tax=Vitis vinifera TaxID=29760 RepID=A0A438GUS4_VITVI|nr:hypothetical protein CK203_051802 [Vitis vinifera]